MGLRFTLPTVATLLVACTGGPGSGEHGYQTTQDRAPISTDGVSSTNESSARSNEGVAKTNEGGGTQGATGGSGGSLDCTGTYSCLVSADGKQDTITLPFASGCNSDKVTFSPDGTVSGEVAGTWRLTSGGFSVSGSQVVEGRSVPYTIDCTKVSDTVDTGDDDDDDKKK